MANSHDRPRRQYRDVVTIELLVSDPEDGQRTLQALISRGSVENVARHLWPLGMYGTPTPGQLEDIVSAVSTAVSTEIVLQLPPQLTLFTPPEAT